MFWLRRDLVLEVTSALLTLAFLAVQIGMPMASAQSTKASAKTAAAPSSKSSPDAQLYRNNEFGFRYQVPAEWVDRTNQYQTSQNRDGSQNNDASGTSPAASSTAPAASEGEVLLAIFERPPNAPGDTINSAVLIASEKSSAYPGLKKAEDYLAPLSELTEAKGFKPDGDPEVAEVDGHRLVRANFTKPVTENLTMYQSTLVFVAKGQIVSFTFLAGTSDEVDDLIDALHFGAAPASKTSRTTSSR